VFLRAFYGPQQAYIVGRVPPKDLVRVAMLKGSVRLVASSTLVRVDVLVRAEEVRYTHPHTPAHIPEWMLLSSSACNWWL
jgi:hypothetical protein